MPPPPVQSAESLRTLTNIFCGLKKRSVSLARAMLRSAEAKPHRCCMCRSSRCCSLASSSDTGPAPLLWQSAGLTRAQVTMDVVHQLRDWRRNVAHDFRNYNLLTQQSLAARVRALPVRARLTNGFQRWRVVPGSPGWLPPSARRFSPGFESQPTRPTRRGRRRQAPAEPAPR